MFAKALTAHEPEHRAILRRTARDWLDRTRPLSAVRALAGERRYDRDFLAQMGAMGWLGLLADPEAGLDCADLVALHRELGRRLLPEPVVASGVMAASLLGWAGNPAHAAALAALCSGEQIATLAWQGGAGATTAAQTGPRAEATAEGYRLDGTAAFVPWAGHADAWIVAAQGAGGIVLGWLPRGTAGVTLVPGTAIDRSEVSDLRLSDVLLPASAVIAGPDRGADLLDRVLDLGRMAISAELVGAAEAAFAMTLDYLRERKQFGRAIGANQALQFTSVDLFVQIELANSVLSNAARRFDGPDRARLVAGCKSRCSDIAFETVKQAIQLHGAIGYTDACDVSLYVKRVMSWAPWLGNGAAQRARLGAMARQAA